MARDVYDLKGYTIVLDKVAHITKVFKVGDEGFQFNVVLVGDLRLLMKFPDLTEATLQRELFVKALRGSG